MEAVVAQSTEETHGNPQPGLPVSQTGVSSLAVYPFTRCSRVSVNLPKSDAETNHNAAGGAQGEVPPHGQASSKKYNVKRPLLCGLCVFVGAISITAAIFGVAAYVTESNQSEKKSDITGK
jgi:hypothetical protein